MFLLMDREVPFFPPSLFVLLSFLPLTFFRSMGLAQDKVPDPGGGGG
jgi:hypothetical protein